MGKQSNKKHYLRRTRWSLTIGALALAVTLTGYMLIDHSLVAGTDNDLNDGNPYPPPSTSAQAQQAAHAEAPDVYCSPDQLGKNDWTTVGDDQMAFAYLPTLTGSTEEIKDGLEKESSKATFNPYSTNKILLASTSLGSSTVADDAITKVSVTQITTSMWNGWKVTKCGPEQKLHITSAGSTQITYRDNEGVRRTKNWTVWELSGDGFNPKPKDKNTEGFSAEIAVNGHHLHTMLSNNHARLPGSFVAHDDHMEVPGPGVELMKYYYEHHVWS
ncbi:hypothetical protein [Brevibacterium linens]|uniref:Uncharacterized protein n=1 Tax=Brevibacterium linens ATCC 9172 TaxID=1255617 RepID=A0A2H1KBW9_BRELN|nr:hypothetical protein [Brevibacterium linens]KAB1945440.1 hypothetical protein F8227_13965 [Brevibacterium linens ATCC 9172]SMX97186.1 hypothetical protein BLIN9172_03012 [Brevibacterium linens ATCC 9172]